MIPKNITRLRISAHKLRIETERFNNKLQYIPPEMRTCLNCNREETEDEFHVVIACPKYSSLRDDLFQNAKYCLSISMNMGMKKSLFGL